MISETTTAMPPATCTVHTPNGPVHSCDDHAKRIVGLMSFLGAHAAVVPYDGKEPCANCVNETKLK